LAAGRLTPRWSGRLEDKVPSSSSNARISSHLLSRLAANFPEDSFKVSKEAAPIVVVPAVHPEVGNVEIHDDGNELTVVLGNFTHSHFANYDDGIDDAERAKRIADALIDFLKDLFADRIELYGSHKTGGGARLLSRGPRGVISRTFFGGPSYVWSGPLRNDS
jgi:hypothetical protein